MKIRLFRKGQTAARMAMRGQLREAIVRANQKLRLSYVDFDKESLDELGIERSTGNAHQASGWDLNQVLDRIGVKPGEAIVDIGAGKGGALLTMAKYPFKNITGVEISPKLVQIAKRNMFRLGRWRRIRLVCANAVDFTDLDEFNYIFLYNPFPAAVMNEVIKNIKASLGRAERRLTIIYSNPQCEACFSGDQFFEKIGEHLFPNRAPTVVYACRPAGSTDAAPLGRQNAAA